MRKHRMGCQFWDCVERKGEMIFQAKGERPKIIDFFEKTLIGFHPFRILGWMSVR